MKRKSLKLKVLILFLLLFVFMVISTCTDGNIRKPSIIVNPVEGCYFESSFETATGNSENALLDGGRWDRLDAGEGQYYIGYMEVVNSINSPYGTVYPVDGNNMLKFGANGDGYESIVTDSYIRPGDEDTYLRFYIMMFAPAEAGHDLHGIQDHCESADGRGSDNFWVYHNTLGDYNTGWYAGFFFRPPVPADGYDFFGNGRTAVSDPPNSDITVYMRFWDPNESLDYYRWYRVETHVHWLAAKTSSTPLLYDVRIYDDTNTLVVDGDVLGSEYYDNQYHANGFRTINELYAEGRRVYANAVHPCLMFGVNGTGTPDQPNYYVIDRVAFSNEGWIGE